MNGPQHARMSVAKIRARFANGYTADELDEAEEELRRHGLISNCRRHDDCVLLADVVIGAKD